MKDLARSRSTLARSWREVQGSLKAELGFETAGRRRMIVAVLALATGMWVGFSYRRRRNRKPREIRHPK